MERSSDLPDEARPLVEEAIALFRALESAGRPAASKVRKELKDLHEIAVKLHSRLAKLITNPAAHAALTIAEGFPKGRSQNRVVETRMTAHLHLASFLATVNGLAEWFSIAGRRVPPNKRGSNRKAQNVRWLVTTLDGIRTRFTGRPLRRSTEADRSIARLRYDRVPDLASRSKRRCRHHRSRNEIVD